MKDKYSNVGAVKYASGALRINKACGAFNENSGKEFEVIGNIYENPELLHVKE